MPTKPDDFDVRFAALMYDHPRHSFAYGYCVIFTTLSILNEAAALLDWQEQELFVQLLFTSAVFAGVLLYSGRRLEEKRRVAHLGDN